MFHIILFSILGLSLARLATVWIRVLRLVECPKDQEYLTKLHNTSFKSFKAAFLSLRSQSISKQLIFRYYSIELCVTLLIVACLLKFEHYETFKGILLVIGLIVASIIDFEYCIIPDSISIGGTIIGLLLPGLLIFKFFAINMPSVSIGDMCLEALLGAAIGSAVLMWLGFCMEVFLKREAMGFGDVKLMGFIGSFCGWKGALFAIFGGSVIGTLVLILATTLSYGLSLITKVDYQPLRFGQTLPFGPWLTLGALCYYLL
jgi:leader peptidase (prepilin peptidase)/N-methyltransferase